MLIPAYNEENIIVFTINSVLEWICKLEVIVVDDGSNDGTGELLDAQFGRNPACASCTSPIPESRLRCPVPGRRIRRPAAAADTRFESGPEC